MELANVMERIVSTLSGNVIRRRDLPFYLVRTDRPRISAENTSLAQTRINAETEAIRHALQECRQNKSSAARMLGIHRTQLYKKMRQYGIHDEERIK